LCTFFVYIEYAFMDSHAKYLYNCWARCVVVPRLGLSSSSCEQNEASPPEATGEFVAKMNKQVRTIWLDVETCSWPRLCLCCFLNNKLSTNLRWGTTIYVLNF
jgi:hypothetical protein